ncbi:hypothetical protein Nepgr_025711 [Nepenthes gracilis]|uniref:Lipase n=1 Tax=Nepenthes gracilis TaxID=150966 RepID=A0AAD3T5F6_NEPGR|nr:hypothetical protein Nepgr_025711 [Nepenthes gracilis]
MAAHGFLRWACLSVCILAVVVEPPGAHGTSRAVLSPTLTAQQRVGACAVSVTPHGYKCQEIEVTTEDGYILSLQRIPESRAAGEGGQLDKPPVLIQHGVLVDGTTWLLNPPDENLPFILADAGFDVWIANTRGTRFSRKHVSLDPNKPEYWNWSWDELVMYDLPATIDVVYRQTRDKKIYYVGHSLGSLIALASLSEGRLVDKLRSVALLSPVAYLSHMTTALGIVAAKAFVGEMTTLAGMAEFNPKGQAVANFLKMLCNMPNVDCYDYLSAITGKNCCLNSSTVDIFLQNEPQSTSVKNMVHLAQTVRGGILAKYNYGRPDYNLQHYGEEKPPVYNLSNIPHGLPLFMSYGGKDALSDIQDVAMLLDCLKLHDQDKLTVQFIEDYAHADFIMGVNAKDLVYREIIKFFKRG